MSSPETDPLTRLIETRRIVTASELGVSLAETGELLLRASGSSPITRMCVINQAFSQDERAKALAMSWHSKTSMGTKLATIYDQEGVIYPESRIIFSAFSRNPDIQRTVTFFEGTLEENSVIDGVEDLVELDLKEQVHLLEPYQKAIRLVLDSFAR